MFLSVCELEHGLRVSGWTYQTGTFHMLPIHWTWAIALSVTASSTPRTRCCAHRTHHLTAAARTRALRARAHHGIISPLGQTGRSKPGLLGSTNSWDCRCGGIVVLLPSGTPRLATSSRHFCCLRHHLRRPYQVVLLCAGYRGARHAATAFCASACHCHLPVPTFPTHTADTRAMPPPQKKKYDQMGWLVPDILHGTAPGLLTLIFLLWLCLL